jgi:predicted nuclease of predicted toxin-antitoxin system
VPASRSLPNASSKWHVSWPDETLLDENLPRRLVPEIEASFPGSSHVVMLGLEAASDAAIWRRAREAGYTIVTKDADFMEMAVLHGAPPKVIRLALGNASNAAVRECLLSQVQALHDFLAGSDAVLELDRVD